MQAKGPNERHGDAALARELEIEPAFPFQSGHYRARRVGRPRGTGGPPDRQVASVIPEVIETAFSETVRQRGSLGLPLQIASLFRGDDLVKEAQVPRDALRDAAMAGRDQKQPPAALPFRSEVRQHPF